MSGATTDPAELLSASQVAALLHIRKQDALDLIASGEIPTITLGDRYPRVLRATLLEWLKRRECVIAGVSSDGNSTEPSRGFRLVR